MSSIMAIQSSPRIHQYQISQYRPKALPFNPIFNVSFSRKTNHQSYVACNNVISLVGFGNSFQKCRKMKRDFVVCSIEAGNPIPSGPPSSSHWKSWVLGIIVSVILPLATGKLGPLSLIKDKFDMALQNVENIVETVEKVAGGVEKAAEHLLDELPDGQLKKVVSIVEHIAERAAKDADSLDDVIDMVQEESEKLEEHLEAAEKKAKESVIEDKEQK
ncbi:hypothetical protein LIER_15195 [Lithospermum erythrorhizon]|uniref:Plastid-targeted protein 2 n=1 Tax=Lithospermum erythrorhizon TaxID=34254 RepID=A0AAV3Q3F6_LITER